MQIRAHGNGKRESMYKEPTSADPKSLSERKQRSGKKKKKIRLFVRSGSCYHHEQNKNNNNLEKQDRVSFTATLSITLSFVFLL